MGISARIATGKMHPDALFANALDKIVLGDLSQNPDDRTIAIARLTTTLDSSLSLVPSCQCGYIKDHLGLGTGVTTCPKCKTPVTDNMLKSIQPVVFINAPDGCSSLIQPIFLSHFKSVYNKKSFDTLRYLLDTSYTEKLPEIEALQLPRGLNNFVNNLPLIMDRLNTIMPFKKKANSVEIVKLYQEQQAAIHCNYIYVINRALVIIDKSPLQIKLQKPLLTLIDIVLSIIGLNTRNMSLPQRHNRLGKALCQLVAFYEEYFRDIMGGKYGGIRTQLFNIRAAVCQYEVLTSITYNIKHPEEIHLPYTPTLHMLYPQIMGKLLRAGFTQPLAAAYIQRYSHTFSPKLHQYIEEVLGLNTGEIKQMIFQRYPTLSRGSAILSPVYKVKKEVMDKSVSTSILGVKSTNSDLDGDHVVLSPCPPYPEYQRLAMRYNMVDVLSVRKLSPNLVLSMPVCTNILNWREHTNQHATPSPVDVAQLYG